MAAAITTTAASLEEQLSEVAGAMQELEVAQGATNRVTITPNVEGGTLTYSVTLPAVFSNTGGAVTMTPQVYLT